MHHNKYQLKKTCFHVFATECELINNINTRQMLYIYNPKRDRV